jgi:hypothetical protein
MRNLLGRLHARRLPELLRIAEAWSVPLYVESKSEVVGALYRAMTDPRSMRDVWDRLDPAERAMVIALADAPDSALDGGRQSRAVTAASPARAAR